MADWQLEHRGDGKFVLRGDLAFETAQQILQTSEPLFSGYESIHVDLSGVNSADSAGLALMLEWKARARHKGVSIDFVNVPQSLTAIAKTTEVDNLI